MMSGMDDLITITPPRPMTREEAAASAAQSVREHGYAVAPQEIAEPAYGERLLGFDAAGRPIVERFIDGYRTVRA